MNPTLNFGESTIKALALRGYKITQIIVTHTLHPQPGEGSLCIQYKVEYEYEFVDGAKTFNLLDFQQVIVLAGTAAPK